MAFGVFIHRHDSTYDDSPAERYQFPRQYLSRARVLAQNWIIYYEPRKVIDTRGYFAIAKVQDIIRDQTTEDMYIAVIEPNTYLDFVEFVPFSSAGGLVERGLLNAAGNISGRAQSAVRSISPVDFNRILNLGLDDNASFLPSIDKSNELTGFAEDQAHFGEDQERERVTVLTSRPVRDRVFRRVVLDAYDRRCAMTGLKLINGGGRAEVAAAHIRPVEANGPDILSNGIALSGTAHWMFDRGLISLSDDLDILISRQANDPDSIRSFLNKTGRAYVPTRIYQRPHPNFLKWHRENCFKQ